LLLWCAAACISVPDRPDFGLAGDGGPSDAGDQDALADAEAEDRGSDAAPGAGDADAAGPPDSGIPPDVGPDAGLAAFPPPGLQIRHYAVGRVDGDARDDLVVLDRTARAYYLLLGRDADFGRSYDRRQQTTMSGGTILIADLVGTGSAAPDGLADVFVAGENGGVHVVDGFQGGTSVRYSKTISAPELGTMTGVAPVYLAQGRLRTGVNALFFGGEFRLAIIPLEGWSQTAFSDQPVSILPSDGSAFPDVTHNVFPRRSIGGGPDDLLLVAETSAFWYLNPGDGDFRNVNPSSTIYDLIRLVRYPDLPIAPSPTGDGCADFLGGWLGTLRAVQLSCTTPGQFSAVYSDQLGYDDELLDFNLRDLDGAGRPELVMLRRLVAPPYDYYLSIAPDLVLAAGERIGTAAPPATRILSGAPSYAPVGDFDGDGTPEVIVLSDDQPAACYRLQRGPELVVPCD
jgi:hypothetical protein